MTNLPSFRAKSIWQFVSNMPHLRRVCLNRRKPVNTCKQYNTIDTDSVKKKCTKTTDALPHTRAEINNCSRARTDRTCCACADAGLA
jgi:hypothetical protein